LVSTVDTEKKRGLPLTVFVSLSWIVVHRGGGGPGGDVSFKKLIFHKSEMS
jgi:hypothetical protein